MAKKTKRRPKKKGDLVLVHGRTDDGAGVNVLRAKEDRVELGTMHPLKEGQPIAGEVVKLSPRKEHPMLFDAETVLDSSQPSAQPPARQSPGRPVQVASDDYRKNWDAIYKRRAKKRELLN